MTIPMISTILTILVFVESNFAAIFAAQQALFSALSALLEIAGFTRWSKAFGTFTSLDSGRIIRWAPPLLGAVIKALRRLLPTMLLVPLAFMCSCSVLRSQDFWDGASEACATVLTKRPDTQRQAKARQLTGNEWATWLCTIPEVIGEFVVERDPQKAGDKAMAAARARGIK